MLLSRPLLRLLPAATLHRAASGPPRSSCTPREVPPCPPCKPFPRPPCPLRGPEYIYAIQITCCPASRSKPQPCKPKVPACAMTCSQAKPLTPKTENAAYMSVGCRDKKCGELRCQVAERHEAAQAHRRAEYLREAAARRAAPPRRPPPPPRHARDPDPDTLKCKMATYCPPEPKPSACGLCAPIDKSMFRDASGKVNLEPELPKKHTSTCKEPLAGGAKCAGDSSWCDAPAPPARSLPRCRAPTQRERLRRRKPCRDLPCLSRADTPPKKH